MKRRSLFLMGALIMIMICACLAMLACGDDPSDIPPPPPPPPGQNSGFEQDTGVLVDHVYEAETLQMIGNSRNKATDYGHQCLVQSMEFNTAFSGNVCMKNTALSTLRLTVTSDKSVNVPVGLTISNLRGSLDLIGKPLGEYFAISVTSNGEKENLDLFGILIPKGDTPQVTNYFRMCTVEFRMNISEGTNVIEIKTAVTNTNIDCFNIRTSAALSANTTVQTWISDVSEQIILTAPTETAEGKFQSKCDDENEASTRYSSEYALPSITDGLASGLYTAGEESGQYYFMFTGTKIFFTAV